MTMGWIFRHNWAMLVSRCLVLCKNTKTKDGKYKYQIVFSFIGGNKYTAEFDGKKARDDHFRLIIRMMEQNYTRPVCSDAHWIAHAICLVVILILGAALYLA